MLITVHNDLIPFYIWIKHWFPECHIAVGWRNKDDQELAFKAGSTKAHWPDSKHNHLKDGNPCSLALDLFLLLKNGKAIFPEEYFKAIYEYSKQEDFPIKWGGNFKDIHDGDHFELTGEKYEN